MRSAACGRRSSRAPPSISARCARSSRSWSPAALPMSPQDHVLFSPQAMNAANSILPRYGALSNRSLDEMIAGARVDVAPYKHDDTDFVLWKPAKPGEPSWPSPAGIKVDGPAGLAHRMLGDGVEASRRAVRHSWRRHRSGVSASRERTRAKRLRLPCRRAWRTSGCTTAFCRSKARRCRSRSATSSPSGNCWRIGRARCCASTC